MVLGLFSIPAIISKKGSYPARGLLTEVTFILPMLQDPNYFFNPAASSTDRASSQRLF